MTGIQKRTALCALLLALALLASGILLAKPAMAATTQVVATGKVNVRSGPGTNYTKLGQLTKDQVVTSTGATGSWTEIIYEDGTAYVSSVYVRQVGVSTSGSSSAVGQAQATGKVNVRTGPGTSYGKLGQLARGQIVPYTGITNGWYEIEYEDGTAYVSGDYIKTVSGSVSTSTSGTQMQALSNVNVRSGPGTKFSKLGQLKKNDVVAKTGSSSNWIKIDYNGKTGYVREDYLLTIVSGTPTPTPTPTPSVTDKLIAIRATTMRDSANTSGRALAYLGAGDTVTKLGDSGLWYKVQLGGTTGYVYASDMQTTDMSTVNAYRTVMQSNTPYYASEGTTSRLGYFSQNQSIFVVAANSSWSRCTYNNQTVYVQTSLLSTTTNSDGMTTVSETRYILYSATPYYTSASTSSTRLGQLSQNQNLQVTGISASWARCTYNNQTIYVQLQYLSGGNETMTAVSETRYALYNSTPYYAGTSGNDTRLGFFNKNQALQVTGVSATWVRCAYNGQTVYVPAEYLSEGSAGDTMTTVSESRTVLYHSTPYYSSANTTSTRLGYFNANQALQLTGVNATWARCVYNGQAVYVQLSYLSAGGDASMSSVNETRQVAYNNAPYYSSTTSTAVLGYFVKGQTLTVTARNTTWARCTYGGQPVYVQLTYLTSTADSGMTVVSETRSVITHTFYYEYANAPNYLGSVLMGATVQVTATDATWAKCILNGSTVYIRLSDLSAAW